MIKFESKQRGLLFLFSLLITCTSSAQQSINVSEAWVRIPPPGVQMLAGYGTFTNLAPNKIELIEAHSKSFESIGFHISEVIDGISSMHKLHSIVLQPRESVIFEPGGKHLMIYRPHYNVQPESVTIEFLDKAGESYSIAFSLLKSAPE